MRQEQVSVLEYGALVRYAAGMKITHEILSLITHARQIHSLPSGYIFLHRQRFGNTSHYPQSQNNTLRLVHQDKANLADTTGMFALVRSRPAKLDCASMGRRVRLRDRERGLPIGIAKDIGAVSFLIHHFVAP